LRNRRIGIAVPPAECHTANVSAAVMAVASLTLTNAANSAILFHRVLDDCGGLSTDGGWVDAND
jgi:hypothetical protein